MIQLTGGNDGLNTVVPYADDQYHKNRPTLAIPESNVLRIDEHCGFHPSLRGFADLLEAGRLAVVQGVHRGRVAQDPRADGRRAGLPGARPEHVRAHGVKPLFYARFEVKYVG